MSRERHRLGRNGLLCDSERRRLGRSGLLCHVRGVGWAEVGCCVT